MKAIGFTTSLPIEAPDSFQLFDLEQPKPGPRDVLVRITAVSVNPVDYKVRQISAKDIVLAEPKIIGWDAVGVVEALGQEASLFQVGQEVYYAGDLTRPGCYAEYQAVDERLVGRKPASLTDAEAAALPLTALTVWELLFDRLRLDATKDRGKMLLIIGGAGGVGSLAIQLAKTVAGLTVLATASRPESVAWCRQMGADIVVDHHDLVQEVRRAGVTGLDFIVDCANLNQHWDAIAELIKPQGHIVSITGSAEPVALTKLKQKSVSFSWEYMFTRAMFQTDDMQQQGVILHRVAELLTAGQLVTTLTQTLIGFTVSNFQEAHRLLESGKTIGKVVIQY